MNSATAQNDRRAAYRVQPTIHDGLDIAVRTPHGEVWAQEVVDVTLSGIASRFRFDHAQFPANGERVTLHVVSSQLCERVALEATVVSSVAEGTTRYCRFRFDDSEALARCAASCDFFRLFNRRVAHRGVETYAEDTCRAALWLAPPFDEDAAHTVRVRNLASNGMCIIADAELDPLIAGATALRVSLWLTDLEAPLELGATVRYRHEANMHVYYGLMFVPDRTEDYRGQAESIFSYMLDRFDEELEQPKPLPAAH